MKKVITYGTFDLIHYGHIRLLERAKALGDYLIVGITADDYDKSRGKINVAQSLMERIENVRKLMIADEIIVEEYEGQKIDDIKKYGIDIFTVGSDWIGKFDYLREYCEVVYLERTQGVSSTEIRVEKSKLRIGLVGESVKLVKFYEESRYVDGVDVKGIYAERSWIESDAGRKLMELSICTDDYSELLKNVDALYIASHPDRHYDDIAVALKQKKHVLCESPIDVNPDRCRLLFDLAEINNVELVEMIKTAYSTAYSRMLLLAKSGSIGEIVSVETTCTRLQELPKANEKKDIIVMNSINAWGPTAVLPVLQLLGTEYKNKYIISKAIPDIEKFDIFTQINFLYPDAVATVKVGRGVKSEGDMVISGTKGYVYVPAPWWKTEYFEIRHEDPNDNRRYFYQLDGEGIRYAIIAFKNRIEGKMSGLFIDKDISVAISSILYDFNREKDTVWIE